MNKNNFKTNMEKQILNKFSKTGTFLIALFFANCLMAQTPELVSHNAITPSYLTESNGELFFAADSPQTGRNWLWNSDGTTVQTLEGFVTIDYPGTQAEDITAFDNQLIFSAQLGNFGSNKELYKYASLEGITLIKDIQSGAGSNPRGFTELNGNIYFSADDGSTGRELWVTDGTETGTLLLKSINAGSAGSNPYRFFEYDEKLLFVADDGTHGQELWVTDGTSNGTELVKDIRPGSTNSSILGFTSFDNKVYFRASNGSNVNGVELWVTDGTESGTYMLKDINSGSGNSLPRDFTEYQGKLYFYADDGTNGMEVWVTDGTESGTELFKNINPGSDSSNPVSFLEYNGNLYFGASARSNEAGLWMTDGTSAGTVMVKQTSSRAQSLLTYDNRLYFEADDENGGQLWVSDGTTAGTEVIAPNIAPNNSPIYIGEDSSLKSQYKIAGGTLFYSADYDNGGLKLYKLTTNNLSVTDNDINEFTVYPNPVKDILHLETSTHNIQKVALYSIMGQHLQSWEGESEINISQLAPGNYFVKITTDNNQSKTEKILKVN